MRYIMRSAIIDIGYNAIRAVVYDGDELGAPEVFNDKFKSHVINLLELEDLDVKHQTYLSLQYLSHIFDRLEVTNIKCVATAVLRGHPRAHEFKGIVKRKFNIDIDIISGEREAYLMAGGLISGINDACGIVVDLGGGSLELAQIENKKIGKLKSFPLGTKLLSTNQLDDIHLISQMISSEFGEINPPNLYLIGGALRVIGRFYMESINYPLKNLHNFEINILEFELYLETLTHIIKNKAHHYEAKFINYNAILILKSLIQVFSPKKIVISNYGLKEGVRFDSLPRHEQEKDIVYERTKKLLNFELSGCEFEQYISVITPHLIDPDPKTIDTLKLAIILSGFYKNIDRTLKVNFIVEFILAADIPFSHRQRLMLSTSLAASYTMKTDLYINQIAKSMINKTDYYNSHIIGAFIKIAREIDGPEFKAPSFHIHLASNKYLQIITQNVLPRTIFDRVRTGLKAIYFARKNAL